MRRPDLDNREIALEWLGGSSQLDLSTKHNCSMKTIRTRLAKARNEFPELPWDDRRVIPGSATSGGSGVKDYVRMTDGKPGESTLLQGSIVNGRTLRRR